MRIFIFIILVVFSSSGYATDISLMNGFVHPHNQSEGVYWVDGYPHNLPDNTPSVILRADTKLTDHWSYGVGIGDFGHFGESSIAPASDYANANHIPYPSSHWAGSQKEKGIFLLFRYTCDSGEFVEAGPAWLHTRFDMHVPDYQPSQGVNSALPGAAVYNLNIQETENVILPLFGIGYKQKNYFAEVMFIPTGIRSALPAAIPQPIPQATFQGITRGYSPALYVGYIF